MVIRFLYLIYEGLIVHVGGNEHSFLLYGSVCRIGHERRPTRSIAERTIHPRIWLLALDWNRPGCFLVRHGDWAYVGNGKGVPVDGMEIGFVLLDDFLQLGLHQLSLSLLAPLVGSVYKIY